MDSMKRFTTAAMQFCAAESELRALSIESRPCSEKEPGNPMVGDFGILPCDVIDPEAKRCAGCEVRFQNGPRYRAALNERQKAKKRMMRAFPSVKENL